MLSERQQQLLTASLDGELTPAKERELRRLLRDSDEARRLHQHLIRDAQRLRSLPRRSAPINFVDSILESIDNLEPTSNRLPYRRPRTSASIRPAWAPLTAAAAVLFLISSSAFLFFLSEQERLSRSISHRVNPTVQPNPKVPATMPAIRKPASPVSPPASQDSPVVSTEPLAEFPNETPTDEGKTANNPTGLASPIDSAQAEPFEVVPIRLALILSLSDIRQATDRKRVDDELKKDEAHRLELFCRDSHKGIELVQNVLRGLGLKMIADPIITERQKRRLPTTYLLYTEQLTPVEVATSLAKLATEDQAKSGDYFFDKFILTPLQPNDRKDLIRVLGVDPLANRKSTNGIDLTKPIADSTRAHLEQTLQGDNGAGKRGERTALIVPFQQTRTGSTPTREVRQFLDGRLAPKPGTTPLLLVVRTIAS